MIVSQVLIVVTELMLYKCKRQSNSKRNYTDMRYLETAPQIEAQNTRHGDDQNEDQVEKDRLLTAPAPQVNRKRDDVLKYSDDGREGSRCHEHEEQRAPDASACHLIEDVRQGDEQQVRAGVCLNTECRAGREDNHARHQCDKGIQNGDGDCFAGQRALLVNIRAKNSQCADTKRQGEECLTHCSKGWTRTGHPLPHTAWRNRALSRIPDQPLRRRG